jgi:hypothetical protein
VREGAPEGHVQDPQREVVVVVERLGQKRVLRAAIDEPVNPAVGDEQRLVVVGVEVRAELGDELLGLAPVLV